MPDRMSQSFPAAPARMVRAGLWMFFAGAVALFSGAFAELAAPASQGAGALAERLPDWPTWFVPETAVGFTLSSLLVCWGVWMMGAGLRRARASARR